MTHDVALTSARGVAAATAKLPATWEEFEQRKADLRAAEQLYWAGQPQSAKDAELRRLFTRKEGEEPEPWVGMEAL
jgi:hypothetical protein